MFTILPKLFALAPTNRQFAEKNWVSGNTVIQYWYLIFPESLTGVPYVGLCYSGISHKQNKMNSSLVEIYHLF